MAKAEEDAKSKRDKGYMPFRMWLKKGEEVEIIILDDAFVSDESGKGGALIREHNLKDSTGKWGNFESCSADFAPCPLCDKAGSEGFGASTYVVMLSVLVLREWTSSKSGEKHAYSRMLLPIKMGQKEKFLELQKHAFREQGSMRGLYLVMKRGMDDQSVATGEPTMLDNGKLYDLIEEDELVKDYGHPPIKNREGKVIKPANGDLQPFDYTELFPRPDPDDLAQRFGGRAAAGSRRSVAEAWEDEEVAPAAEVAIRRRRGAPADEETADVPAAPASVVQDGDTITTTRRSANANAASPPAPARRRSAPPEESGSGEGAW
jgi:hypothetical protein